MLSHFASLMMTLLDAIRRLRYRRASLRTTEPAKAVSDNPVTDEAIQWIPPVRVRGRSCLALMCLPNSSISYDVVLPRKARVTSWCALTPDAWTRNSGGVEFKIEVHTDRMRSVALCLVDSRRRMHRRWHRLTVSAPGGGAARVTLSTSIPAGASRDYTWAVFGDPAIESPRPARAAVAALRTGIASWGIRGLWRKTVLAAHGDHYGRWVQSHEPSRALLRAQRDWSTSRTRLFSVITFVATPSRLELRRTADSIVGQSYPIWEWIVVVPEAEENDVRQILSRTLRDRRVRLLSVPARTGRAAAWNRALGDARGTFACLVDPNDQLAPSALYEVAFALEREPGCDLLYSDEDRMSARRSGRHEPRFKPGWSPDLLVSENYVGRLALMRIDALLAIGAFRDQCDGAEEWDLFLRMSRGSPQVKRLSQCLYHRAERGGPVDSDREELVLREHFQAFGVEASVSRPNGNTRVVWPVQREPLVTIVIPNRNAAAVLTKCVHGLLHETGYPHREIVIVDNGSAEPAVLELYRDLERDNRATIVPFDRPFNFSAACNAGAAAGRGDLLLFLNNDIEIIDAGWLEELVRWAQLPHVGVVGAKLLYPDRSIQHAGIVFGLGLVGHIFSRAPEGASGIFGSCEWYRNYLAVTGACQMMRREVFDRLGGYDERFRLSFSDVVLCLEAWKAGYRVVYTPYARLVHHESYTRRRADRAEDQELLVQYLETSGFFEDPFFHPELNAKSPAPALRPPFDPAPDQVARDYMARILSMAAAR